MKMTLNEHNETNTLELGAALECNECGNNDPEVKSGSLVVEAGGVDACKLTSSTYGTPTDLPECPTVEGNCGGISEEESKGDVTNNGRFPVPCKSTCSLSVSETELSKCKKSREGNCPSLENDGSIEEKSPQDDYGDFATCRLTSPMNPYENGQSKCPKSIEEKISSVENDDGSSEYKVAKNSQSRERKKSKYLSSPFIDLSKGSRVLSLSGESEIDGSESVGQKSNHHSNNSSLVKCDRRRRQSRKAFTTDSSNLEAITASSAELLLQLHMVAQEYLNPYYDRAFDPTELFFNSFRASVFSGLSSSELTGVVDIQNEQARTDEGRARKQNKNPLRKIKKVIRMTGSNNSGLCDVNVNIKPQRKRKRKEVTTSAPPGPNQVTGIPDLNCNNGVPGGPKVEPGQKKRKRKKGTTPNNKMPGIPYAIGNNVKPISLEVCLQDAGPYPVAPSSGLNPNISGSPGSCANGVTPRTPAQAKCGAEPTLDQMKQSLEFMTSMLEKSSGMISPEMRANLENEIKNLLKKVNPLINSSSS